MVKPLLASVFLHSFLLIGFFSFFWPEEPWVPGKDVVFLDLLPSRPSEKLHSQPRRQKKPAPPAGGKKLGQEAENIVPAKIIHLKHPEYPREAQRKNREGTAVVLAKIDERGNCVHVQIEKTSGFDQLDELSLEAVRKATFLPARKGRKNIPSLKKLAFRYGLDDSPAHP